MQSVWVQRNNGVSLWCTSPRVRRFALYIFRVLHEMYCVVFFVTSHQCLLVLEGDVIWCVVGVAAVPPEASGVDTAARPSRGRSRSTGRDLSVYGPPMLQSQLEAGYVHCVYIRMYVCVCVGHHSHYTTTVCAVPGQCACVSRLWLVRPHGRRCETFLYDDIMIKYGQTFLMNIFILPA